MLQFLTLTAFVSVLLKQVLSQGPINTIGLTREEAEDISRLLRHIRQSRDLQRLLAIEVIKQFPVDEGSVAGPDDESEGVVNEIKIASAMRQNVLWLDKAVVMLRNELVLEKFLNDQRQILRKLDTLIYEFYYLGIGFQLRDVVIRLLNSVLSSSSAKNLMKAVFGIMARVLVYACNLAKCQCIAPRVGNYLEVTPEDVREFNAFIRLMESVENATLDILQRIFLTVPEVQSQFRPLAYIRTEQLMETVTNLRAFLSVKTVITDWIHGFINALGNDAMSEDYVKDLARRIEDPEHKLYPLFLVSTIQGQQLIPSVPERYSQRHDRARRPNGDPSYPYRQEDLEARFRGPHAPDGRHRPGLLPFRRRLETWSSPHSGWTWVHPVASRVVREKTLRRT
uniref:Uncharacterized protein n=1 Tax=Timema bartmani TaxID=61472 RepID=A0A7R9F7X0_9NEOP|nr:unnamed protein product [Timema bartmani]